MGNASITNNTERRKAYIHPNTAIITLNVNGLEILIERNFQLGFKTQDKEKPKSTQLP